MLAGLLLNEPRVATPFVPGGIYGVKDKDDEAHERAERALVGLREEYLARTSETIDEGSGVPIGAKPVYHIPPIADIQELNLSGVTAIPDEESVDANELALLLIIAEL